VRWVFPPSAEPVAVAALSAFTRSRWDTADVRLEADPGLAGREAEVEVHNGLLVEPQGPGVVRWPMGEPLRLGVRYSRPAYWKGDRTLLLVRAPGGSCAIAVEYLLQHQCVYVRPLGLFAALGTSGADLAAYRREIAGQQTVLERVREMPDETLAAAMEAGHNPLQDRGPVLLSLACHNRKFVVEREGTVRFSLVPDVPEMVGGPVPYPCTLQPTFGRGAPDSVTRHLHGGWLPVPVTTTTEGGVVYRQRTFVAPVAVGGVRPPLCVAEVTIENRGQQAAEAAYGLTFAGDDGWEQPAVWSLQNGRMVLRAGERVLAWVDPQQAAPLTAAIEGRAVRLTGVVPAGGTATCVAYVPGWEAPDELPAGAPSAAALLEDCEAYWRRELAGAMQVELPDELLTNVIRASQVHCLLAARQEADGAVAPWIASVVYGPLDSEAQSVIHGMDLMGHQEFAQHSLEFFIKRYQPSGLMTHGYTTMGTGWHLWTLAEHYQLTKDQEWMRRVAPDVARAAGWIAAQRVKTQRPGAEERPEYGLVPPGVVADWGLYAYRFFMQAHFYAGLHEAAEALAEVHDPTAPALQKAAAEFRADLERAYAWAQAHHPVMPLQDGTWVPGSPAMLYCFGPVAEFFPGQDWNRSWAGDVEVGPQHLVPLGVLEPESPAAAWMMDYLEDYWFLHSGMGDYAEERNRADWFHLGGFGKVQPYYGRFTDVYAQRDEVKPFIRSYLNAIPSLLNTENLSFWEHFANQGAWNKTHETGWFLQQTRTMLVMERGEELWLAPFVTDQWMQDGMEVSVRRAPTRFGPVSYRLRSDVDQGCIEAVVDPPTRERPQAIVLRVRHPEGRPMRAVTVNGRTHADFDSARQTVRLPAGSERMVVRVQYGSAAQ